MSGVEALGEVVSGSCQAYYMLEKLTVPTSTAGRNENSFIGPAVAWRANVAKAVIFDWASRDYLAPDEYGPVAIHMCEDESVPIPEKRVSTSLAGDSKRAQMAADSQTSAVYLDLSPCEPCNGYVSPQSAMGQTCNRQRRRATEQQGSPPDAANAREDLGWGPRVSTGSVP